MKAIKKILMLENMLSMRLFFLISELKYAYKFYAYTKSVFIIFLDGHLS